MKTNYRVFFIAVLACVFGFFATPAYATESRYSGPIYCYPGTSSNINGSATAWEIGPNTRIHYDADGGINTRSLSGTKGWLYKQTAYVDINRTRIYDSEDAYATTSGHGKASVEFYFYTYKKVNDKWVYQLRVSCGFNIGPN